MKYPRKFLREFSNMQQDMDKLFERDTDIADTKPGQTILVWNYPIFRCHQPQFWSKSSKISHGGYQHCNIVLCRHFFELIIIKCHLWYGQSWQWHFTFYNTFHYYNFYYISNISCKEKTLTFCAVNFTRIFLFLHYLSASVCYTLRDERSDCKYFCHCAHNAACDRTTGACPGECDSDWFGPACQYGKGHNLSTGFILFPFSKKRQFHSDN